MSGFITSLASPIKVEAEDSFAITFAPLSLEEVYALADAPSNGAVVVMSGTVRNQTDGKPVVALEYQASLGIDTSFVMQHDWALPNKKSSN